MKQPLWILNSVLFGLIIIVLCFILLSQVTIEEREDIKPGVSKVPLVQEVSKFNIKKIYEQDIFGTFIKTPAPIVTSISTPPTPRPPSPSPINIPEAPDPKFLDPLNITLKGIISVGNSTTSSAIISDNKTKRESIYNIGDSIEDAQLVRIFNNKVFFVRSNGQQEVFYLREKDAQNDPAFLNIDDWNGIVKKTKPNNYIVSPIMFAKRIKNLAQFIDLLGLSSAYYKGKSVGCRVGNIAKNSLGEKLGLKEGDIILSVEDIAPTKTQKRLKIYKKIVNAKESTTIVIKLQRGRNKYTLKYELRDFRPTVQKASVDLTKVSTQQTKQEQKKILERNHKFAPTARDIRSRERQNMFRRGSRPGTRR